MNDLFFKVTKEYRMQNYRLYLQHTILLQLLVITKKISLTMK